MNLGLFLAIGESLTDFQKKGQLKRLLSYNVKKYADNFDRVYIFSYTDENFALPSNCTLVSNRWKINRFAYALLMPILQKRYIAQCDILRGLQLTGGIPAVVSKLLYGKKFVINYGYDYPSFAQIEGKRIQSFLYRLIIPLVLPYADAVIITSRIFRKKVSQWVKSSKINYIPNGVDLKLFQPREQPKRSTRLKIVFLGRLEKQKNLATLIRAVSFIQPLPALSFFGEGKESKNLIMLARKLKVNLAIHPPQNYEKIPKILSNADIFAIPSLEEGSPKALLEAMAAGLGVIGSDVKGIREIIRDGQAGILTKTDSQSIAAAINKLKNSKVRQKLGQEARRLMERDFDLEKLLDKEITLLKEIQRK